MATEQAGDWNTQAGVIPYLEDKVMPLLLSLNEGISLLLKQERTDGEERLIKEIKKRQRMETADVTRFLRCTPTWSLKLMKRIGAMEGFRFHKQPGKRGKCYILFLQSTLIKGILKWTREQFDRTKTVTTWQLMDQFHLEESEAKTYLKEFVFENKDACVDGPKIIVDHKWAEKNR